MGTLRELSTKDFDHDLHAAKYRGDIDAHSEAFNRLFALLNDYDNEHRLASAEIHGFPALAGVVRLIEADPAIARALENDQDGQRFCQAVGVAIRLKMEKIGWAAVGMNGIIRGSSYFTEAERFIKEPPLDGDEYKVRALAATDAISKIGDVEEQEQTYREIKEALAATRHAEGRFSNV